MGGNKKKEKVVSDSGMTARIDRGGLVLLGIRDGYESLITVDSAIHMIEQVITGGLSSQA
jgi:hypothetical protein